MRKLLIIILFLTVVIPIGAQGLTWSLDFNTIFDNRENDYDYYSHDQTIFLTRLSPEVGMEFLGGAHRISGGAAWIQPVGNEWHDYKICPTLYYGYRSGSLSIDFGMFPRTHLIEPLPDFLLSDSIAYKQPNIRGVLVQYVHRRGFVEMSLDWRSLQSETQREAFNVNVNAMWNPRGMLIFGGHLQVNHLAKQKNPPPGQGVNDDIMINPYVGVDLSHRTLFDSLTIKAGGVLALERTRVQSFWHTPGGALFDIFAQWRSFGIKETLFAGSNLFPLYPKFGTLLNMGEPYYQAPLYSRTQLFASLVSNRFVSLEAALTFHVTRQEFAFWQSLKLRVYMDDKLWRHQGDKPSRGEYLRNIY